MNTIKIISNPYIKNVKFQKYNEENNEWTEINEESNPESELLNTELTRNFFPFKVSEFLTAIKEEFEDEYGKVKVIFKGTDDEYEELVNCASMGQFANNILVDRSDEYIENARDVLPRIIRVFGNIKELIGATEIDKTEIQVDLKKFTEASDDLIPLCVMGNYSSGKSTFINSLIGNEILPNGDAPVTAKVYKITPSKDNDRASIRFSFKNEQMELKFNNSGLLHGAIEYSNAIMDIIIESIDDLSEDEISISTLVSTVLETLNEPYDDNDRPLDKYISEIIEVEIPFTGGLLGSGKHRYAIFDTPGSNSASNMNHLEVLKNAMANMSNGLPIFVSEYKSLDSMDNENLYKLIKELKELDDRFTMIIVNKADEASLPKGELDRKTKLHIRRQSIPKKLYSGGIYFVSSIIALGAKNEGKFTNQNYAEKFVEKKIRFSDPNYEFYKELYQYNIRPDHLRERMIETAKESKNLLLANSGLYSIEEEIENFASKYSAYDKCHQSELFLNRVVEQTEKEIDISKVDLEDYRKKLNNDLNEGEQRLINSLNDTSANLKAKFYDECPKFNESCYAGVTFTKQSLDKFYDEVINSQRKEQNLSSYQKDLSDDYQQIKDNLSNSFNKVIKQKSIHSLVKAKDQFLSDVSKSITDMGEIIDVSSNVDEESGKDLIDKIKKLFTSSVDTKQEEYNESSRSYWGHNGALLKDQLTKIVKGDAMLSEEDKEKLIDLILQYDNLIFDTKAEQIFSKSKFEYRLFGLKDFKYFNKLNTHKIASIYNGEIIDALEDVYKGIEKSHKLNFEAWSNQLLNTLVENIVEFNPELHRTANNIAKQTRKIDSLEESRQKLIEYMNEIKTMLEWKTFNK